MCFKVRLLRFYSLFVISGKFDDNMAGNHLKHQASFIFVTNEEKRQGFTGFLLEKRFNRGDNNLLRKAFVSVVFAIVFCKF